MFLIGNWKMHGAFHEVSSFIEKTESTPLGVTAVLCFPFPYLKDFASLLHTKGYSLGAQDCSHEAIGPFTGQVSASMLKDVGCRYVIVGHPERACFETDERVYKKAERALEEGLRPIICTTEVNNIEQRAPLSQECLIAYEPAVGSDSLPPYLEQAWHQLKERVNSRSILYGGGVTAENFETIAQWFDGFLVGRASLDASVWNKLLRKMVSRKQRA
jgi:triosephosphate isomerase